MNLSHFPTADKVIAVDTVAWWHDSLSDKMRNAIQTRADAGWDFCGVISEHLSQYDNANQRELLFVKSK